MRRMWVLLLAALAVAACDGNPVEPAPVYPSVTGSWAGIGASGLNFFDFTLVLTQTESGQVTGTARLAHVVPGQGTFDFVVRWGAHGYPDVLLALANPDYVDVNFSGRFTTDDKIEALINGSGFNNVPITMTRRP